MNREIAHIEIVFGDSTHCYRLGQWLGQQVIVSIKRGEKGSVELLDKDNDIIRKYENLEGKPIMVGFASPIEKCDYVYVHHLRDYKERNLEFPPEDYLATFWVEEVCEDGYIVSRSINDNKRIKFKVHKDEVIKDYHTAYEKYLYSGVSYI